jgi:hypothetical protein
MSTKHTNIMKTQYDLDSIQGFSKLLAMHALDRRYDDERLHILLANFGAFLGWFRAKAIAGADADTALDELHDIVERLVADPSQPVQIVCILRKVTPSEN